MLQLLIDTATEKAFVGLACDGKVLEFNLLPVGLKNSKYLFPALLELLNRHGLTPKDLELIGCGVGPGSYTGIRVGAAIAQSMAYALRIPLVGLCSLRAYIPKTKGSFAVALDARYGGVYLLKGSFDGTSAQFEDAPQVIALDKIEDSLQGIEMMVTPHLEDLKEKISVNVPWIQWEEGQPSGEIFAKEVDQHYKNDQFNLKAELKLLYLRKTQAEIERELAH